MAKIEIKDLTSNPFRVVEQQARKATLKLVDAEEAEILDGMIEAAKPKIPDGFEELDKLLVTPFRYKTLKSGSRFGRKSDKGIWYGAEEIDTAFTEKVFHQFKFFEDSPELRKAGDCVFDWTCFRAKVTTKRGGDLTRILDKARHLKIMSPVSYKHSQKIAEDLRKKNCEALRFFSARKPGGKNIAVFTPSALSDPSDLNHWIARWGNDVISVRPYDTGRIATKYEFQRNQFLVAGKFPDFEF